MDMKGSIKKNNYISKVSVITAWMSVKILLLLYNMIDAFVLISKTSLLSGLDTQEQTQHRRKLLGR